MINDLNVSLFINQCYYIARGLKISPNGAFVSFLNLNALEEWLYGFQSAPLKARKSYRFCFFVWTIALKCCAKPPYDFLQGDVCVHTIIQPWRFLSLPLLSFWMEHWQMNSMKDIRQESAQGAEDYRPVVWNYSVGDITRYCLHCIDIICWFNY